MPLYKKPDFWNPNTNYISTDRFKSVIIHNNKHYVCNTSHISDTTFNQNYFTLLGSSNTGSNAISEEWDINSTTIVSPPTQINVLLNDTIDSTFSQINNTYNIIANNPLSLYEINGSYFFGGWKNNIDEISEDYLNNEYKEIVISNFHLDTYDYIVLAFTSQNKEDFVSRFGNASQNTLSITVTGFIGANTLQMDLNDNINTLISTGVNFNGSGNLTFRISKNYISVLLNDTMVFNYTDSIFENWQSVLSNNINMVLFSAQIPSFIERNNIEYTMNFPFTVTESIVTVNPPINASDGKLYKLMSNGIYNGNILSINDYVIFQNNLSELMIIHEHNKNIPLLELESFKNKIYERGIIDDVLNTLPINLNTLPVFYTFWTLDDNKLNSINEKKERIIIDVLDNTFKIGNSGLVLKRNDTGMHLLSPYVDILDTLNYNNITLMMNSLSNLGLQLSEENNYLQILKKYNLTDNIAYYDLYLSDTIGNFHYILNESYISNSGTIVINSSNYNQISSPAYQHIKNTKITISNKSSENKIITINGIEINGVSVNTLSIVAGKSIMLDINTNFNRNNDINDTLGFFTICNITGNNGLDSDLYATTDTSFNHHVENIYINSALPTITISGYCFYPTAYKYNIYNLGSTTTVNIVINGDTYTFNMNQYDKKDLIINQNPPLGFQSGVFS